MRAAGIYEIDKDVTRFHVAGVKFMKMATTAAADMRFAGFKLRPEHALVKCGIEFSERCIVQMSRANIQFSEALHFAFIGVGVHAEPDIAVLLILPEGGRTFQIVCPVLVASDPVARQRFQRQAAGGDAQRIGGHHALDGHFQQIAAHVPAQFGRAAATFVVVLLAAMPWVSAQPLAAVESPTFTVVAERARALAAQPYVAPAGKLPADLAALNYDRHRDIRFRPERALWRAAGLPFEVQFFHPGWLFADPVRVHEVTGEGTREISVDPRDFDYGKNTLDPTAWPKLGFAGFRVHYPLNNAAYKDELVVFLGASYFRALGKGQRYGLSARALAIDTVARPGKPTRGEEFPRFVEFWLERPATAEATSLTLHALLDSPRAAGAYSFVITPGESTAMEVRSRLFLRDGAQNIATLGIAPGPGGVHPFMGTHNRLLRLGPRLYLELIAIDPDAPAPAQPRVPAEVSADASRVYAQAKASLFQVRVLTADGRSQASAGSGFVVMNDAAGTLGITNYHVVSQLVLDPARFVAEAVGTGGETDDIAVLKVDVRNDLALIRLKQRRWPALQLRDRALVQGERLYSLGNPLDLGFAISEGAFNGEIVRPYYPQLLFSGAINRGMSGGPAVDGGAAVVGVNVSKRLDGEQISFLVPARFITDLLAAGAAVPIVLGGGFALVGVGMLVTAFLGWRRGRRLTDTR